MQLQNATYIELLEELNSRVPYSPNQKQADLDKKVDSIARKRFLVTAAKELRMLLREFTEKNLYDEKTIYDFRVFLFDKLERIDNEISEIESTI